MITSLKENEIFIFGSNMLGHHIGGAAKQAKEQFGAEEGIGEGLTGHTCYAFPTLEPEMTQRGIKALEKSRDRLFATARALPEKTFLLTAVGTGIAQYPVETMKKLFENPPENIKLPDEFNLLTKSMEKKFDISYLSPRRIGEMLDTRVEMKPNDEFLSRESLHKETGCTSDCRRNGCPNDDEDAGKDEEDPYHEIARDNTMSAYKKYH